MFDMHSMKCIRAIKMHFNPVTCLSLGANEEEGRLIISGSSFGSITVSSISSDHDDQWDATVGSTNSTIKTLCYNPRNHLVFAGTSDGHAYCWDIRTMLCLWETRVSLNVVYSMQHLQNDASTLVVGGIDGVLRLLDQHTEKVLSSCVMDDVGGGGLSASSSYYYYSNKNKNKIERNKEKGYQIQQKLAALPEFLLNVFDLPSLVWLLE